MKSYHWPRVKAEQAQMVKLLAMRTPVLSIDPGSTGGAVFWVNGVPVEGVPFRAFNGYGDLRLRAARLKPRLVILEEAFIGKGIKAALRLGFWRGFAAATAHQAFIGEQTLLEVSQGAWKTELPRDGIPEGAPWDSAAHALACELLAERYPLAIVPRDDGIRSALGIGHWWHRKAGRCTIP